MTDPYPILGAFTLLPDLQGNDILSDGSATAVSVSQSPSTFDVTPGTPWDQESYKPSRDASVGVQSSSAATSNRYDRWCFICEDLKRITTHDGLQKHVLKHFTKHYCIPSNSVMQTEDGPKCAICRVSDPDPRHLNTHTECLNKTFTTRDNLIKHLESKHKFHDASVLAKHAKHTTINQKYFACGFCGFCCDSLNKQVNHVDAIHYKYSAHRSDWDQNTVIRGLLSQPDVHEHWQWFLGANLHLQEPGLKWNPTQIKHLQRRLELGQEDAVVLCQAAISAIDDRSYGRSQQGLVDSAPFAGFRDLDRDTGQSIQTLNREDTSFPLAYSSEQRPLSYVLPMTAPIPSQNLGRKILNHVNQDTNSKAAPSPDVASEGYRWPIHSGYGPAGRHAQTWNSPHVTQYHPPTPTSSSASASDISPAMEGQAQTVRSSGSRGYLPGKSPNVVKHPQSRQEVVTHSYPSQGQVGLPHTTLTTQSASSPLYPIYEAPSLGLLNSAYSPRPHLTLTAPFPQEETTDYHGINMDHGTGSPQRFLQDQHRIKRQRGKR